MFVKNMMFLIFIHHVVDSNHSFLFISSGIPRCEWTTVSFFIHLLMDIWVVSSLDLLCIKITFSPHRAACGNLVPGPGIKPTTPALEARSLTHWTTRESEKVKVKSFSHVRLFATPRLVSPWDFPGQNIGVGCHFLLQGIFLTQGSNLGLWHCRQTLYHLSYQGLHWTTREVPFISFCGPKKCFPGLLWWCNG